MVGDDDRSPSLGGGRECYLSWCGKGLLWRYRASLGPRCGKGLLPKLGTGSSYRPMGGARTSRVTQGGCLLH